MDNQPTQPDKLPDDGITTPAKARRESRLVYFIAIGLLIVLGLAAWYISSRTEKPIPKPPAATPRVHSDVVPVLKTETLVEGYSNIWDSIFPDDDTLIFSVRGGELRGISLATKQQWLITKVANIRSDAEGGLLGLALDTDFANNKYAYMCYDATGTPLTVRVARFKLSDDFKTTSDFKDIISDIESQAGRHSGCRLAMDNNRVLWVGTGDSAIGTAAQNPKSLAGKVLRVDRNGKAAAGNQKSPYDSRIYSYGHRNIQGLVLFDTPAANGAMGFNAEHGTDKNDEINWLLPGNFGYDPVVSTGGYNEIAPMTDTTKFPDAIKAVWSSGETTLAVSGLTILKSDIWKAWQDRVVMAVLKDTQVRLLDISADGTIKSEEKILDTFGRIRSVREGPDGSVYISTDNSGGKDKIIRVTPT